MKNENKTKEQLLKEYKRMQTRLKELEAKESDRKMAEEELKKSESRLAEAQRIAHLGNWDLNLETNEFYWSDEIYRIFGFKPQEFGATYETFLKSVYPEDREYVKRSINAVVNENKSFSIEHRIVLPNGDIRIVSEQGEVTHDNSGKPIRLIGTVQDITDRKSAEEEKEKIQNQLFHIQKMEVIGSMAGGIAHDFNNLLTAITGYAELMQNQIGKENPLYKDLGQIRKIVERAATLVRQLLMFSRKQVLKPEVININNVVSNMEKMLRRLIGENIIFETALEKNIKTVKADIGQVEQVIVNLVVNARDAMPKGGKLIVKTCIAVIDASSSSVIAESYPGTFVCLSVQDTGTGIDQETIQHIFEPFYTTKETQESTGLGLSVVYGIVKQHKGWINIYSEPGEGAIFKVYLPTIAAKTEKLSKKISKSKIIKGKGERILLVEDDEDILQFAKRALVDIGYEIFSAQNAQEAEEIFKGERGKFNILFSDVMLPDKSGFYLAEQFLSVRPELKVILTSGYVGNESQRAIIREKGYHYIEKPYVLSDLLQVLNDVIKSS